MVGGKADDPFFTKVKKGIDDATLVVEAHGGTVNYLMLRNYDNIGGDAANLVRTAIAKGASIIAVPNWVPDTQDEAIKAAMDAGIPVMLYNSGGADKAKELGAINYIGNEEYPAGLAAGAYLGSHGFKNVICVNTVPGAQIWKTAARACRMVSLLKAAIPPNCRCPPPALEIRQLWPKRPRQRCSRTPRSTAL